MIYLSQVSLSLVIFSPNQLSRLEIHLLLSTSSLGYFLNHCTQSHAIYDCVGHLLRVAETLVPVSLVNSDLYEFHFYYLYIRHS